MTAYCKNPLNDQWYSFDDHRVTKLRQDAVVTKSAYLLFYRRRLAQTRCAVPLQQWVSSVCSASYGSKTPDTAVHSEPGNVCFCFRYVQHGSLVNIVVLVLLPIVSAILFEYQHKYRRYFLYAVSKCILPILFHLFLGSIRYQYYCRQVQFCQLLYCAWKSKS